MLADYNGALDESALRRGAGSSSFPLSKVRPNSMALAFLLPLPMD